MAKKDNDILVAGRLWASTSASKIVDWEQVDGAVSYTRLPNNTHYSYSGIDTSYITRVSSNYAQFYIHPAAFGLDSFSDVEYVDMIYDISIIDGVRTYLGNNNYNYYDFTSERTLVRIFFNTSIITQELGPRFQLMDESNPATTYTFGNAFIYRSQITFSESSTDIKLEPDCWGGIFPSNSTVRSVYINNSVASNNCSITLWPLGYLKKSNT